jgi:outer membrane protein assembly factor BamB
MLMRSILLCVALAIPAGAGEWPQWGRDSSRNMASDDSGVVESFKPGTIDPKTEQADLKTAENVRWVVKLGSQSYGNPTVAGGRVYVGTNNQSPRDPKHKGDRGIVMALDAKSGELAWQLVSPKLGTGKVSDWEYLGICSSPAVDGDRVYVVTNRCEVLCLDAKGQADGNAGPYKDEGMYVSTDGKPVELGPKDADIVWRYDMRQELGIFPHNITSCSVLILGDRLYVTTSNGQDWTHVHIPNPRAPALCVLDKKTGELVGEEASSISQRILHGSWSSPAGGEVKGKQQVFFGGPDGFVYGFDADPVKEADGTLALKELWRVDANPPAHRVKDGKPIKYPDKYGPSEIIATPVYWKGRVYVAAGQDPEHGMGVGQLICVDPAEATGNVSATAKWRHTIDRSISTVAIHGGLLFVADFTGFVYCFDPETGALHWKHDTESNIWGSPLAVDGKVYIGNESGKLLVYKAAKEQKLLATVEIGAAIYSSPVVADGVLYVATQTHLYAVAKPAGK